MFILNDFKNFYHVLVLKNYENDLFYIAKEYAGCFSASIIKPYFFGANLTSNHATNKFCASFCYTEGYKLSASHNKYYLSILYNSNYFLIYLIYRTTCVCGDNLPSGLNEIGQRNCNCQCPGNCDSYKCGCENTYRIYKICGRNNFQN